jgi:hypothetical protein
MYSVSNAFSVSPVLSVRGSTPPPVDPVKNRLDELTKEKHVMVFSGFSGLGYNDVVSLKHALDSILDHAVEQYGADHLLVVCGATTEGIGEVYSIASKKGIHTLGIVSEQAKTYDSISKDCEQVVYVDDPAQTWQVLDNEDKSYMAYVATTKDNISRTGEFFAFGGGDVTLGELKEARAIGVKTKIHSEFEPNAEKAAARLEKNPGKDLTPVRTAFNN